MTIAGDLDVIVDFPKPAHERVKAIFDFLTSADVINYLMSSDSKFDLEAYFYAIEVLRKKCAW